MSNWYVLMVLRGKEDKICTSLNKDGIKAFTPWKEVFYKKKGKTTIVKQLLFPAYVFIETNMNHLDFCNRLKAERMRISGIIKELKYENDVSALSKEERNYLEGLMDEHHEVKLSKGEIMDGRVIITEGPLRGYESNIIRIDRHKRRAILNVKINDREMKVDVSLEIVKKIESQK